MMVLNDCCSCANPLPAWATSKAAASAHSLFTRASSIRYDHGPLYSIRHARAEGRLPTRYARQWRRTGQGNERGSPQNSAPDREKVAQQRRGFALADAAVDFGPVQACGRREIAHAVLDCPALGIGGAIIDAPDAGERDRRRAHRAGLERDVEIAVDEPLGAQRLRRAADRHHL